MNRTGLPPQNRNKVTHMKLSLIQKISLSALPLILATGLVSYYIYETSQTKDHEAARAIAMGKLMNESELQMVMMSEALRGFLLNPDNQEEAKKKEEADDAFGKANKQLSTLMIDDPEALSINKTMSEFDASTLNAIEDEVSALNKKKSPDAIKIFNTKYAPARDIQNANFKKLKEIVEKKSEAILQKIEDQQKARGIQLIIFLTIAVFAGLGGMLFIASRNLRQALTVFSKVDEISSALNQTANNITHTSNNLSSSSTEQASAITETATAIEQISSMIQKNSDHSVQSQSLSNESREVAQTGEETIEKMKLAMIDISKSQESIVTQVQNGNIEISSITKLIQEIAEKTKVINDIVFQTKLLSFNASVEAARAGESGKGFAVVAEEVGKLAEMSGSAAQEIFEKLQMSTEKVNSIVSSNTTRVEKLILDGKAKVDHGVRMSTDCAEIFSAINEKAKIVNDLLTEVATASNEQARGIKEINQAVSQLNQTTAQNTQLSTDSYSEALALKTQSDGLNQSMTNLRGIFLG